MKIAKPTPITTVEGTSVTPRQRPKGQGVGTGPISLSGQIVSQISGQGNQLQSQSVVANPVTYVPVNSSTISSINTTQQYLVQAVQPVPTIPVNQPPLQLPTQSSFVQVSPLIISPNQNVSFVPSQSQTSPFAQSQSPLIGVVPLTQQSPVTVQDKTPYYFDVRPHERPTTVGVADEAFDALFPSSGYPDPFKDDTRAMPPPAKIPPPVAPKPATTKVHPKLTTPTNSGPSLIFVAPTQLSSKLTTPTMPTKITPTLPPPVLGKTTNKPESLSQNISANTSPPDSPTLSSSRHRRNVSDGSAFNKYAVKFISLLFVVCVCVFCFVNIN